MGRNILGILALFAEEGTIEDPVGSITEKASVGLPRLVSALPENASFTLDTPIRTSHDLSGAAFAMTVELIWDGKPMKIHSIDVMQFNKQGLITEMKAYYGPSNNHISPITLDSNCAVKPKLLSFLLIPDYLSL
ncbi:hypothetical protein ACTJIV_10400 [Chryseobacterium sp. 22532]|uniref:hypothetical protein n=1 Tax=Chryseobacterium sp. 22532 TaxID=3453938 RepID=UPI003F8432D1